MLNKNKLIKYIFKQNEINNNTTKVTDPGNLGVMDQSEPYGMNMLLNAIKIF